MRKFTTWSRVHQRAPVAWLSPRDEEEVARSLADARAAGRRVKVVGAGHSWSEIALPEDLAMDLSAVAGLVSVDEGARAVTVLGGTRLRDITAALDARGLAMPILGSIAEQTIAGAIATATHGSSLAHGNLASLVSAMRIVTPTGDVLDLDARDARLAAGRVHLGALGVVTRVTLSVTSAFRLAEEREVLPFARVPERLEELARSAEFVKIWWLPSTGRAVVFRYARTEEPAVDDRLARWADERIVNQGIFDGVLRLSGRHPALTPFVNAAVAASYLRPGRRVARSDLAFNLAMPPVHRETEWAFDLPRAALALEALAALVRRERLRINFPCEVRFVKADDAWMSPAFGRDTCQIGVYQAESPDRARWFEGAERIATELGGRPHWGKELSADARALRPLFPRWDDFTALAAALDPGGTLENAFLARVLGPRRSAPPSVSPGPAPSGG